MSSLLWSTDSIVRGIALDSLNNVYFTVYQNNEGRLYRLPEGGSKPELLFSRPKGMLHSLVCDRGHSLYITTSFFQILHFDLASNKISILAGQERPKTDASQMDDSVTPIQDGCFSEALFWDLRGITSDEKGDLYVVDKKHLRKLHMKEQRVETICVEDGTFHILKNPQTDVMYCSRPFAQRGNGVWQVDLNTHQDKRVCEESKIDNPRGLLLTPEGNLLVCNNKGVYQMELSVNPTLPTQYFTLSMSRVIAGDRQGHIYVGTNDGIVKIDIASLTSQATS